MAWYESTEFFIVLSGIGGAIISSVVTIITSRKSRNRKRVVLRKKEPISLINISDQVKGVFEVYYGGERVESAYFFRYTLTNTGNTPIEDQPVAVEFDRNSKIIDFEISTEPKKTFGPIDQVMKDNELSLKVHLLNPNDEISIEVLTIGTQHQAVDVGLKNEGVEALTINEGLVRSEMEKLSTEFSYTILGSIPFVGNVIQAYYQILIIRRGYEKR